MRLFSLRAVQAALAEYFELLLTIAGVLLAIMITLSELSRGIQGSALIFLGWLQGIIVWAVHRHGWFQRRTLVEKLRQGLDDIVSDRLAAMLSTAESRTRYIRADNRESALQMAAEIENLSTEVESLRAWQQRLQLIRA